MATRIWISTSSTDFNVTTNWSGTTVPVAGDAVVFDGTGTANVTTNLNQSAVAFASITVTQANTCQIGTLTTAGVATYLQHAAPLVYIGQRTGQGAPSGSTLMLFDSGSTTCTYAIYDSAASSSVNAYLPPIQIKGSALTISSAGGNYALAPRATETATATIKMAKGAALSVSTPAAYLGAGVTVTALTIDFGSVFSAVANTVTAAIINGGTYEYIGSGAHTTLTVNGAGICYYSGTGTISTLNLSGQFDRTRDGRSVTITNTNLYNGAKFLLDNGVSGSTVRTNPPALVQCGMSSIQFSAPVGDLI